jgi:hypothetical protein
MTLYKQQVREGLKCQISGRLNYIYVLLQLLLHVLELRRVVVPSILPPELGPAAANELARYLHPPQHLLLARREVGRCNLG